VLAGQRGKATVQVNNVGTQPLFKVPVSVGIYCSADDSFDAGTDAQLVGVTKSLKLKALGGLKRLKLSFFYPTGVADAGYHLFAVVDPLAGVTETSESNNLGLIPGTIRVAGGTLAPAAAVKPSSAMQLSSVGAIEISTTSRKDDE